MRNIAGNFVTGAIAGSFIKLAFDRFNEQKYLQEYRDYGLIYDKKSYSTAIALTLLMGSIGLFYSAPRTALGAFAIDFPLMFFLVPSLMLRPIFIIIAVGSVASYNSTIDKLHALKAYERGGYY